MNKIFGSAFVVAGLSFFASISFAQANFSESRTEKGKQAQQALLNLQFFTEGRGMVFPPGLLPASMNNPNSQNILNKMAGPLNDEFGLIVQDGHIVGVHQLDYANRKVSVLGCAICHSGRAAGFFIPGLGNKNIDVSHLADVGVTYLPWWNEFRKIEGLFTGPPDEVERILKDNSNNFLTNLSDKKVRTSTQGLVPIGIIRKWFFDQAWEAMDVLTPGEVKVPAFWGYGEKRKVGNFSDGFGNGAKGGWAIAVELVAGQTVDAIRRNLPHIEHAEDVLSDLVPPAYPFRIDGALAERGQTFFEKTCAKCHGTYTRDAEGLPIYQEPLFVPINIVKTDDWRLRGVTDKFRDLVRRNPLNDLIQQTNLGAGYMAPRLAGIWARFPYLHNASVPTIYDLLTAEEKRPKYFTLHRAGDLYRFDMKKLGLAADPQASEKTLVAQAKRHARWVYDTTLPEHGNQGHSFQFIRDMSEDDRTAVIEYLKTL